MTSHLLLHVLGKADYSIIFSVSEIILGRLNILPFLGVRRGDLSKFCGIRKDSDICRIGEFWIVVAESNYLRLFALARVFSWPNVVSKRASRAEVEKYIIKTVESDSQEKS